MLFSIPTEAVWSEGPITQIYEWGSIYRSYFGSYQLLKNDLVYSSLYLTSFLPENEDSSMQKNTA